jgi:hypothetical protein
MVECPHEYIKIENNDYVCLDCTKVIGIHEFDFVKAFGPDHYEEHVGFEAHDLPLDAGYNAQFIREDGRPIKNIKLEWCNDCFAMDEICSSCEIKWDSMQCA